MTERILFGTDGVRGVAGHSPMTAEFALHLGVATAEQIRARGVARPRVVIGMDTRRSGPMLAHAVTAGLASRGVDVTWLGVMPTPGVAFLTRVLGAAAGVVISASHNPFEDNGIKIFGPGGEKLSDAAEAAIEATLGAAGALEPITAEAVGGVVRYDREAGDYLAHLLAHAPYLDGMRVGLDCANGAASEIAPTVFRKIGARLDLMNATPDGININAGCGSTHPEAITARVLEHDLEVGITFDGDADRALLVDRRGRLVTGDHILAICGRVRGEQALVATLMTNLGVERYLAEHGVALHRTAVGDRYVLERLQQEGLALGGEQSGHVLFLDKAPTGDGILTALQLLAAVRKSRRPLEAWMDEIPVYPQTLVNVRVPAEAKRALADHPEVRAAVDAAAAELAGEGRINLRPSGTEPLVRVMVEGADAEQIDAIAGRVAAAVEQAATGAVGSGSSG